MLVERMMPRKLRGFTLTEAAIVLGIVGLILGAIWVAAAAVYNNLRVSTTSNQMLQLVQNVRSMHATQQTMDTALAGTPGAITMAQAGAIPKDMVDDPINPAAVRDVWNGDVTFDAATSNGGVLGDSFTITLPNVPRGACTDILVRNTGAGRDSGLLRAGADGGVSTSPAEGGTQFPITVTQAIGYCNGANDQNTLTFTFALKT